MWLSLNTEIIEIIRVCKEKNIRENLLYISSCNS